MPFTYPELVEEVTFRDRVLNSSLKKAWENAHKNAPKPNSLPPTHPGYIRNHATNPKAPLASPQSPGKRSFWASLLKSDPTPTDANASPELLLREQRRQLRRNKMNRMRTARLVEPDVDAHFRALRHDTPGTGKAALQPGSAWEKEQKGLSHEEEESKNKARIRKKALEFQRGRPMSPQPPVEKVGDRKSCFSAIPKVEGRRMRVRFDDAGVPGRVRWVDAEGVDELARASLGEEVEEDEGVEGSLFEDF
ncbi:hypothetical protein C7974DRAFT_454110 [Boeremia exigua]|uniref:uncharacterized protein n=1 Tax=Boeremia exigua TaxID=749465 RepID=UPI001E8D78D6|nr:uncharacterized protein C7974DRAFT_454110 [Boeremia exigua]KAH6629401.1 hypothetical protein C7974DRAFT_454110 [Boeremia exigua]